MIGQRKLWKSWWVGLLLLGALPALAQPWASRPVGPPPAVSDSLVRHYLARAMTLQGFNGVPAAGRRAFAQWAAAAGTRFAGRVGGFWATPPSAEHMRAFLDTLRATAAELHRAQPALVVQATVFELVCAEVSNLPVPNAARAAFGEDTLAVPQRNFRFADMMYPSYFNKTDDDHYRWDDRPPGQAPGVPDMSRPETQLWFYTVACQQLDVGCEAVHFGQVMRMDDRDPGHHAWWSMLQRVRAYARTRNRGFVLCDAHTHDEYYDPDPDHPLPPEQRQLLFDFHSCPMRPIECDTIRRGPHSAYLDYADAGDRSGAIYGRSGGGVAPDGTYRAHLPALVELDNGTLGRVGEPGQRAWGVVWGVDEISWFATQPSDYRSQWLVYAAARVRQLDPAVYLEMPGMRGVNVPPQPGWLYRADTMGQAEVVPAIWQNKLRRQTRRLLRTGPCRP